MNEWMDEMRKATKVNVYVQCFNLFFQAWGTCCLMSFAALPSRSQQHSLTIACVTLAVYSLVHSKCNTIPTIHNKSSWVTSATFLCGLSCISVTKECYQIDFLWGASSLVELCHQKTYLTTISTTPMQQSTSSNSRCVRSRNFTRNDDLTYIWADVTKSNFSTTLLFEL